MGRMELIKLLEALKVRLHYHSTKFLSIKDTWKIFKKNENRRTAELR